MERIHSIEPKGHVVIVSIPRLGHVIPMLDLAKHLSVDCNVTFVVSMSILEKIKTMDLTLNNDNINRLEFIGLFDNNNDENKISDSKFNSKLENDIDQMNKPLIQLFSTISIASSSSSFPFTRSITRPIHMIISDIFNPLPIQIAHQNQILSQIFMFCHFENLFRYIRISKGELVVPMSQQFVKNFLEAFPIADGVICNSIGQLEKHVLDRFHQQSIFRSNLPVRFVGPLFSDKDRIHKNDTMECVKEWLDMQQCNSVIYIAFGSIVSLSSEQIVEISHSLASFPYIWSLKNDYHKYLPSSNNNDDQTHLVLDWVPQRFILSHSAVQLFISHGGWNSVLECMSAGKPMLIFPMFGDQFSNGHRIEYEFQIGRVIPNTKSNGHQRLIPANEINQYVQEICDPKMFYIEKAQELKSIIRHARDHTSGEHVNEIIRIINLKGVDQGVEHPHPHICPRTRYSL